jgi:Predicted nucleoside-diphosphate-sugar epimerases
MDRHHKTILVTGATGKQGGATVRHLLADGWRVRALVRNRATPQAEALFHAGCELAVGDFDDRSSLEEAMQGVYGVFSVQPFGYQDEIRRGTQLAQVAKAANVQHYVHTSVGGAQDQTRFRPGFSKWEIEQQIAALELPATILRPAGFMDDLIGDFYGVPDGHFAVPFLPDALLQVIAVDDIGAFAAMAFAEPARYIGRTIELASAALTPIEIAQALSRVAGRPIPYRQIPIEQIRQQSEDIARVCEWLNEGSYRVDLEAVWRLRPTMISFDYWLEHTAAPLLRQNEKAMSSL